MELRPATARGVRRLRPRRAWRPSIARSPRRTAAITSAPTSPSARWRGSTTGASSPRTSIYTRHVTVPGAIVPCAAVTAVGVMPTHRRRGLLTAMMRRQLEDVRARRRAGRDPVGVGGRDLRALRLRHRGAHRAPDRPPPRGAAGGAARRRATRCARGRRPTTSSTCARCTSASAASARACSTARGRGGTPACTTPSPSATAPSRCRPSSCPTAMRSTRCAPTATRRARRAR